MRPKPDLERNHLRLKGEGGDREQIHDITDLGGAGVVGAFACHRADGTHFNPGIGKYRSALPKQMPGGFPHFVGSEIRAHARGAFLVLKDEARLTAGDMPDRLDYPDGMYAKASRPSRFRDALGQRAGAHISRTKGQAEAKARIAEAT